MERQPNQDDTIRPISTVYDAALAGCVVTLDSLIKKDPMIFSEISFTSYDHSPLHLSTFHGHLDFTETLLKFQPQLASELDSRKRSPLHFAAAKGFMEIARVLLKVNKDVCLGKDQHGRIPLHYAVMRGQIDMIQLLLNAERHSILVLLPNEETAFHLCVQHNQLEALKQLVDSTGRENTEFLNAKVLNTILHLAITLNQVETVDYLLSISGTYKAADDLLDDHQHLVDMDSRRTQRLDINKDIDDQKSFSKIPKHQTDYYKREDKQGAIMVVATVIATTAFQTAMNPPGGKLQESAAKADNFEYRYYYYHLFIYCNIVAFSASISVILLILGGFALKNKVLIWVLTMAMCVTLFCMGLTFVFGIIFVNPMYIVSDSIDVVLNVASSVWMGLLILIVGFHIIQFGIWLFKKFKQRLPNKSDVV